MATKPAPSDVIINVEEALELIDKTMERVKSLYEQYFLGIQKQPPTFIHNDLERKLRDLQQIQIRNTALRYRYATLQQKFGSYNSYWRRTLRQIENGTYVRSLAKIGRKAIESGADIPEEILAKMPKRMREQVRRDREAALALAERRNQLGGEGEGDFYDDFDTPPAAAPKPRVDARGAHVLDEDDGDLDLDAFFAQVAAEDDDDESTTFSAPPAPTPVVPSGPANLRAATLGGMPRAQSPAVRAQTNPGVGPAPTPQAFRATGPQRAITEPGQPPDVGDQPLVGAQPLGRPAVKPPMPNPSAPRVPGPPIPTRPSGAMPVIPPSQSGSTPAIPGRSSNPGQSGVMPAIPQPGRPSNPAQSGSMPAIPRPGDPSQSGRMPAFAPSQGVRPNPIAPGSSQAAKPVGVETMQGPFAREPSVAVPPRRSKRDTDVDNFSEATPSQVQPAPTPRPSQPMAAQPTPRPSQPIPTQPTPHPSPPVSAPRSQPAMRPTPTPARPGVPAAPTPTRPGVPPAATPSRPMRPPPGMTDDDVNSLYAKYVKAKEAVGETTNAQTYNKLLNTINAQAPKIMEQYKAKGVDFSVVVKDNQVIIKAKPKP